MEHADLIAELPLIEKLTAVERIQLAKQRRMMQLMRWQEREQKDAADNVCCAEEMTSSLLRNRRYKKKWRVQFSSGTVLLEATARHDVQEVKQMLLNGADPNCHNEDGLTALHQCAIDNDSTIMELLIEHGAEVNTRDTELWTPLHAAACCGHISAMKMLIKHGAELLAVNSDGNMPYDICDEESALDYIETEMANRGITQDDIDEERLCNERRMLDDMQAMHERNESLDIRDKGGATPLHAACASGYYSVVEFLLECGCWVHVRDNDGWQPIHAAACWAQPDIVELLVQFGADINARTNAGETPLDVCEDETTRSVLLALLVEVHRRRLLTFARDSRRMSKRKKPCSKFESPAPVVSSNQESRFSSTRSAVRRMSIRDRCGVTLARLEARREAAVMRSWSFGESDKAQPQLTTANDAATASEDSDRTTALELPPPTDGKESEKKSDQTTTAMDNALPINSSTEKGIINGRSKKFWEKLYSGNAEAVDENQAVAPESTTTVASSVGGDAAKRGAAASRPVGSRRRPTVDERRKATDGRTKPRPTVAPPAVPPAAPSNAVAEAAKIRRTGGNGDGGPSKTAKISRLNCCAIS